MTDGKAAHVLTSGSFRLVVAGKPVATFSELNGIKSSMASTPYTFSGANGGWIHSRQFGQVNPPEVSLKKGVEAGNDMEGMLWAWHIAARKGLPMARVTCGLLLLGSGPDSKEGDDPTIVGNYTLENAWPMSVTIGSMKAGASEVVNFDVVLTCDEIKIEPYQPFSGF